MEDFGKQILILDRGWVIIGNVKKENDYFIINECAVIRRWGTERGLGQIAFEGPTRVTILDETPEFRVHELKVVGMIKCLK